MYLERFVRDAGEATKWDHYWNDKFWYPPKGQVGKPWMPDPDSIDEKLNLGRVEILFGLFMAQLILASLAMILSIINRSDDVDQKSLL